MDRSVIRQLALEAPRISLQVGAFVKVGNHEHLQELRSDGLMYCNHIDYFRPIENEAGRGDSYEGTSFSYKSDSVSVVVGEGDDRSVLNAASGLVGRVDIRVFPDTDVNLFCLYAVTNDRLEHKLDRLREEFGSSALVINRPSEFLERVGDACRADGIRCEARLVDYVSRSSFSGELGVFRKFDEYQYQNEFRFSLSPAVSPARRLIVGPIDDLSNLVDLP